MKLSKTNLNLLDSCPMNGEHYRTVYNKSKGTSVNVFNSEDFGTVQYRYFDKNGEGLTVRRNEQGNFVNGNNEIMSSGSNNWFENSIYIGPNNPSDYRREPQDLMDAAALQHDKDYDLVEGKGFKGAVVDKATLSADISLVQRANKVIEMYKNKETDRFTGEKVSEKTFNRAQKVAVGFTAIVNLKTSDMPDAEKIMYRSQLNDKKEVDNTSTNWTVITTEER